MKTKSKVITPEIRKTQTMNALNWFLDVGYQYGTITKTDAFNISRVDPATFYRWMTGKAYAPLATLELIRLHAFGEPPAGRSLVWRGFRFQNDTLITEDGRALTPADLKAVFFWRQLAMDKISGDDRRVIYDGLRSLYQRA